MRWRRPRIQEMERRKSNHYECEYQEGMHLGSLFAFMSCSTVEEDVLLFFVLLRLSLPSVALNSSGISGTISTLPSIQALSELSRYPDR